MSNVWQTSAPTGQVEQLVTAAGSTTVIAAPGSGGVLAALTVPSGTLLEGLSTTNFLIPLPGSVLGSISIETVPCVLTPRGDSWATQIVANMINWSWYVAQNGGASEVHVVFFNTGSDVTTAADLSLLFYALTNNVAP